MAYKVPLVVLPTTLALNASTTTITDGHITALSGILLVPTSASAAAVPQDGAWIGRQVITGTQVYTPTANTALVDATIIGGGAAGGSAQLTGAGFVSIGGAGGAGGGSRKRITAGFSGVTVTIGLGGTPGAAGNNPGGNGGNSTFGAILTANGGTGGAAGLLANTVGYFLNGSAGGTASGGDVNISGQWGHAVGYALTSDGVVNAAGGSPPFGLGLGAPSLSSAAGAAGISGAGFGAAGNGALNDENQVARQGGAGTAGVCIIDEYSGPTTGIYIVSKAAGSVVIGHPNSASPQTVDIVILG